jgi:hypothetical protein
MELYDELNRRIPRVQLDQNDILPREMATDPLTPGLHIMKGRAARGKTVTALAWRLQLEAEGHVVAYKNIMEPRGMLVDITPPKEADAAAPAGELPEERAARLAAVNAALGVTESPVYSVLLGRWMNELTAKAAAAGVSTVPVLFCDSLTYLLKALSETQLALSLDKGPTFKEGLAYGDILGVLHHTLKAETHGVALVGVVNQDLFPVIDYLQGAAEGRIDVTEPGRITRASRGTGRRDIPVDIDPVYMTYARELLGYDSTVSEGINFGAGIIG